MSKHLGNLIGNINVKLAALNYYQEILALQKAIGGLKTALEQDSQNPEAQANWAKLARAKAIIADLQNKINQFVGAAETQGVSANFSTKLYKEIQTLVAQLEQALQLTTNQPAKTAQVKNRKPLYRPDDPRNLDRPSTYIPGLSGPRSKPIPQTLYNYDADPVPEFTTKIDPLSYQVNKDEQLVNFDAESVPRHDREVGEAAGREMAQRASDVARQQAQQTNSPSNVAYRQPASPTEDPLRMQGEAAGRESAQQASQQAGERARGERAGQEQGQRASDAARQQAQVARTFPSLNTAINSVRSVLKNFHPQGIAATKQRSAPVGNAAMSQPSTRSAEKDWPAEKQRREDWLKSNPEAAAKLKARAPISQLSPKDLEEINTEVAWKNEHDPDFVGPVKTQSSKTTTLQKKAATTHYQQILNLQKAISGIQQAAKKDTDANAKTFASALGNRINQFVNMVQTQGTTEANSDKWCKEIGRLLSLLDNSMSENPYSALAQAVPVAQNALKNCTPQGVAAVNPAAKPQHAPAMPQRINYQLPMSEQELQSWPQPAERPNTNVAIPQPATPAPAKPQEAPFRLPTGPQRSQYKLPKGPEEVPEPGEPIGAKSSSRTRDFLLYKFSKKYDK